MRMRVCLALCVFSLLSIQLIAQPYNFYRGNLHSHTQYSDGNSGNIPYYSNAFNCYQFADSSLQFDFLGISEHNHNGAGMVLANYALGVNQALSATTPSFLALYGMEWGTISGGGHVVIYGVDSLMGWEAGNYSIFTAFGDYNNLFSMIKNRPSSFCYLAHPEATDYSNLFTSPYSSTNDEAIVGAAVRSGPAFSTDTTYTNPSTFSYYQRYKDLLALGYHLGPLIDHDNHYITFGRHTPARTVVLANSLTKPALFDAMKNYRFYAAEDWNVEVNFTVNSSVYMGQTTVGTGNPSFQITVNDPDVGDNISYIRIRYALQNGGNTAPAILASSTTNTLNFTHTINNTDAYYYFLEIRQLDGNMIYTAPIWYTKSTALPVELISFTATSQSEQRVELNWATASETNSDKFIIEHSMDGENWNSLTIVEAAGNSTELINYTTLDNWPHPGLNYYRLTEFDKDGTIHDQRVASTNVKSSKHFDIFPNPTNSIIYIQGYDNRSFDRFSVYNLKGELIEEGLISETLISLDVSEWPKGTYYVHFRGSGDFEMGNFVVE